jgi:hypothetical protein
VCVWRHDDLTAAARGRGHRDIAQCVCDDSTECHSLVKERERRRRRDEFLQTCGGKETSPPQRASVVCESDERVRWPWSASPSRDHEDVLSCPPPRRSHTNRNRDKWYTCSVRHGSACHTHHRWPNGQTARRRRVCVVKRTEWVAMRQRERERDTRLSGEGRSQRHMASTPPPFRDRTKW